MYHQQCELLMPHESFEDMGVGQSHLAAVPAELNFHLLSSYVDNAVSPAAQPAVGAVEYLFGGTDHQPQVQLDQQAMAMLRDYYGQYPAATETYLCGGGPRTAGSSSSLVPGATDDIVKSAYMVGRFELECSAKPRTRKRGRVAGSLQGGGGVEKKEKQRRQRLSDKFNALMLLIPSRTKEDRATVIYDAIEYIQELGRTVEELTLLVVEKNRRRREQQGDVVDAAAAAVAEEESSAGEAQPIRSTYIQRRSKETLVDVRIVEDEVNIKLTKRRRDGCLAAASRALDDLRLDLVHLSGGKIGDCHIYMFNTKIHQGSPVFASAVASKLIQVVDDE